MRIAAGLFKKLVVADHLAGGGQRGLRESFGYSGAPLAIAFYLCPIQLYMDFHGWTDMAIGSALLLGIVSPENFDRPFLTTSISRYWRRWHMSLTFWLADYVFKPPAMTTRDLGKAGLVLSIAINMIAIGLWHGFTWGYFIFGAVHAVFLSVDALSGRRRRSDKCKEHGAEFWLVTLDMNTQTSPDLAARAALRRRLGVDALFVSDHLLDDFATRERIRHVVLAPEIAQYTAATGVFVHGFAGGPRNAGHWNEAGH